jgi:protein phosphatase
MVGLPGAGKSTWLAARGANPLSSDAVRQQLADDVNDQTINRRVFATLRYLLEHRIALRRPVTYIDATNLTRGDRRPWIGIARGHDCLVEAVFFDIPPAVCRARNNLRYRVVPAHAIDLMAAKLVPPSLEEGFSSIVTVGALP